MAYNTSMEELVPFQAKRKKQFPAGMTKKQAVTEELAKHFTKYYPAFVFGTTDVAVDSTAKVFGKQQVFEEFPPSTLVDAYLGLDDSTLSALEIPMLLLIQIAKKVGAKRPYLVLPKTYQKIIKRTYTSKQTLERLTEAIGSKKLAKKYLRIMQQRLGIYTKKKTTV